MPLPSMVGSDDALMSSPGMQAGSPMGQDGEASQPDPQEQARGAVKIVSELRTMTKERLSAIATQFPSVSKSSNDLMQMFDKQIQAILKDIIKTAQMPEPQGPAILR